MVSSYVHKTNQPMHHYPDDYLKLCQHPRKIEGVKEDHIVCQTPIINHFTGHEGDKEKKLIFVYNPSLSRLSTSSHLQREHALT